MKESPAAARDGVSQRHIHDWALLPRNNLLGRLDEPGKSTLYEFGPYVCKNCPVVEWRTTRRLPLDPKTGNVLREEPDS